MTTKRSFSFGRAALLRRTARAGLIASGLSLLHALAQAQSAPPTNNPNNQEVPPVVTPQSTAGKNAAVKTLDDARQLPIKQATGQGRPAAGSGDGPITRPTAEGSRVLAAPGKCAPKTNSLDCVAEDGQAPKGANVSDRVRNSVIGEVGAGRAATEGGGKAKEQTTCTPVDGKLTCK